MTTLSSLNALSGALSLGFPSNGTITLHQAGGGGGTTTTLGSDVVTFGSRPGSPRRSGAVTLTADDVSYAIAAGKIYNLIAEGADPTGFDDASPFLKSCIEAAVNGAGIVYIPSGKYLLSNSVTPSLSSSGANIAIIGDSADSTTLTVAHDGIGLVLNHTSPNPFSTTSIRNLTFFSEYPMGLSAAALELIIPGVNSNAGAPYVSLVLEDIKITGAGSLSNTFATPQQAFGVGLSLTGGINVRIDRVSFSGFLAPGATAAAGNAIELTSSVEVDIRSCFVQNWNLGVAILDGGCQGIYLRNSTFVGVNYLLANAAAAAYNAPVASTLTQTASIGSTVLTLSSFGTSILDPYTSPPALGYGMELVNTTLTINHLDLPSSTVTLTGPLQQGLSQGQNITFQYRGFFGYPWSGIAMAVVDSNISANSGFMRLGLWAGVHLIGNDFSRPGGVGSTVGSPIRQFDFVDVADCVAIGNNFVNGAKSNGQTGTIGDTCFNLAFGTYDANGYIITGNKLDQNYDPIMNIGSSVFEIMFLDNDTGSAGSSQFVDLNTAQPQNFIIYMSSSGVLTSIHPLTISGAGNLTTAAAQTLTLSGTNGLVLGGLPTTNPGAGSGKLWNHGGVLTIA